MKYLISLLMFVVLLGCGPRPDTRLEILSPGKETELKDNARFKVSRVGVIDDDLAYGDRRGIYTIVDSKTGKEYVGLSGVGIAETGSHNCGKNCTQKDER